MNNTINTLGLNQGSYTQDTTGPKNSTDKDSFLQLMIAQLQAQTPLEPVDNSSMLEQMSNFSSMEQQQELNSNLTTLLEFQSILARLDGLSQGSALIGREVDFVNANNQIEKGVVDSVRIDDLGQALVKVGDSEVPLSAIVGVRGSETNSGDDSKKVVKDA